MNQYYFLIGFLIVFNSCQNQNIDSNIEMQEKNSNESSKSLEDSFCDCKKYEIELYDKFKKVNYEGLEMSDLTIYLDQNDDCLRIKKWRIEHGIEDSDNSNQTIAELTEHYNSHKKDYDSLEIIAKNCSVIDEYATKVSEWAKSIARKDFSDSDLEWKSLNDALENL